MNRRWMIFAAFLAGACGASKSVELSLTKLDRTNASLVRQQEDQAKKIGELTDALVLLQDRVEMLKLAHDRDVESALKVKSTATRSSKKREMQAEDDQREPFLIPESRKESTLPTIHLSNEDLERSRSAELAKAPQASEKGEDPEASRLYNEALSMFSEKKYLQAISHLGEFVTKYPKHSYTDNALYWMGESYFELGDFAQALASFERVTKEFPSENKVPDAMLRSGACLVRMSNPTAARSLLDRIVETYPQSVAASKAKSMMAELSDPNRNGRF